MIRDENPTVISRDPFSRIDHIRRTEHVGCKGCAWCGQMRKSGKLFRYGMWRDGGGQTWDTQLFCSRQCFNSYHGGLS